MTPEIPENSFTCEMQLRFNDTDQAGHVNHATFVTYMETARVEWMAKDAIGNDFHHVPIIIARLEVDYLKPIQLHHSPKVSMWVSRIGTKSFDFEYIIHDEIDGEQVIFATGMTVQVYFDYEAQESRVIPDPERQFLEQYYHETN